MAAFFHTNNAFWNTTSDTSTFGSNILYATGTSSYVSFGPPTTVLKEDTTVDGKWIKTEECVGAYKTRWEGDDEAEYSRKAKSKKDALAFHAQWVQNRVMLWEKKDRRPARQLRV